MFKKSLKRKKDIKNYKNLNDTLKAIFFEISNQTKKKNIILFSPTGASFDSFKNFEDRGIIF